MACNGIATTAGSLWLAALCLAGMPTARAAPPSSAGDATQQTFATRDDTLVTPPASNSIEAAGADTAVTPAVGRPDEDASIADDVAIRSDVLGRYLTRSKASVYFVRGSLILTGDALVTITENAQRLKGNPDEAVVLIGYIEDVGSPSYNVALAEQRAFVVKKALVDMGVPVRQIRSSMVNREPPDTVPCETEICRTSYRRVEFAYATPR
jgi:outer membrane protein OmpA-like peptidoglycan-associated protein